MADLFPDLDSQSLLIFLVLASIGVVLFFKRYMLASLDSLLFFMTAQIADIVIVLAFPMENALRWQLFFYIMALWVGFILQGRPLSQVVPLNYEADSIYDLRTLLLLLGAVIVLANLYLGVTAGFPLLSSDPSEQKFTVYSGGLGMVRQLNMGPYAFLCAGCSLLIVCNVYRRLMAVTLTLTTLLTMMNGSKSALLPVLFALSFATAHPGLGLSELQRRKAKLYLGMFMGVAIALALIVTTKDQGSPRAGIQELLVRLLYSADVILFYVPRRPEVVNLINPSILGFFDHNVFSGILGLLRITDYTTAVGSVILGTDERGPNVQYFIQADLFMGPVVGTLYCVAVGYAISWFRANFISNRYQSLVAATVAFYLALISFDLAMEVSLFVSEVFITALCVVPMYLFVMMFRVSFRNTNSLMPYFRSHHRSSES